MTIFEKIKEAAHQPLDFNSYNSSLVQENTNSLSHVIGSTVTDAREFYRIGMISGKKPAKQDFFSATEVRELFLADLQALELEVEELAVYSKPNILNYADKACLAENQHLAVLIVQEKENGKVWGFHFLRYDPGIGWSSKKFGQELCTGDNVSWPSNWYDHIVATFRITR